MTSRDPDAFNPFRSVDNDLPTEQDEGPPIEAAYDLPEGSPASRKVTLTAASTIKVRPVRWLWEGRLPLGGLSLLGGREGIGKSICAYTLAAEITKGRLTGAYWGKPRSVIVAATEDSWEHTINP